MTSRFLRNVIMKGMILFIIIDLLWTLINPQALGRLSSYNILFRGRERLPFGENPSQSYNLSLFNMDAMFASHKLDGAQKDVNEFRVIIIGDSSVWGTLLKPDETLAGVLDKANLQTTDGKSIHVYNLGYPTLSLVKDLMLLEEAKQFDPDLILWPMTLESFPRDRQLESPIVANNLERVTLLKNRYGLNVNLPETEINFWERTLIGQRRELADLLRLQIYGIMWSATGIDQIYPSDYEPAARDLEADESFNQWQPRTLTDGDLAFDMLSTGMKIAGNIPVLIINEPILVSTGLNSNIRYNFYYPRWAYDQYRTLLLNECKEQGWQCLDAWNIVPEEHFTNSAIHLDSDGEEIFADLLIDSAFSDQK